MKSAAFPLSCFLFLHMRIRNGRTRFALHQSQHRALGSRSGCGLFPLSQPDLVTSMSRLHKEHFMSNSQERKKALPLVDVTVTTPLAYATTKGNALVLKAQDVVVI